MIYIIAECAQGYLTKNKEESIGLAIWLVRSAKLAGADAIKFQLVLADELSTKEYKYYNLFRKLDLGLDGWQKVCLEAKKNKIDLIFDVFGEESLSMVEKLGVKKIKLHPTDFRNYNLLNRLKNTNFIDHIFAGSGGSLLKEIKETLNILGTTKKITLLHGFQGYPTPLEDNCLDRLRIFESFAKDFGNNLTIGFADHVENQDNNYYQSVHLSAMAIGLGARTIEKHLTLSRCLELEDSESALSPDEMKTFINTIRVLSDSFSDRKISNSDYKLPTSEYNYRQSLSRHIVSKRNLSIGQIISEDDICLKRSNSKNPIYNKVDVIGNVLRVPISENQPIEKDFLEK